MKSRALVSMIVCAGLIAQFSVAQARSLDDVKKEKSVNIVVSAASPPHGFKNPASNKLEGVMVEVADGVASRLGLTVKLIDVPFSGLIPTLTSGRADFLSAPLFITEERAKVIDFSSPIYQWGEGIIVSDKATKKYGKLDDLKGQRVGVLVDSVQFNMIKDMADTKVSTYQDYATLLADVRAGRIDLGVIDPPSIIYQIQSKNISGVKIDTSYQPQKKWQIGMAVEKGNKPLLDAVNGALAEMRSNGEMAKIMTKWGVSDLMVK